MTPLKPPGNDLPDNLPLLTQVADENTPDDLPTLTEVVAEGQADTCRKVLAPEAAIPASCVPNEEETQQLLRQLEIHLENALVHKLSLNLEQLQRQAVEQAVSELKAELTELLHNALNARHGL